MTLTKTFDPKQIDSILDKTIATVTESKEQLFEIGEQSRQEFDRLLEELRDIKERVHNCIEKRDVVDLQLARYKSEEDFKNLKKYGEFKNQQAYDTVRYYESEILSMRQKEAALFERRDDIERRLSRVKTTVEKAERLVSQFSIILNYLNSDREIGDFAKNGKEKQKYGFQIIEAQEDERARFSRDIHDGPAQLLANVLLRTELIEKTYDQKGVQEAHKELKELRHLVKDALTEVRRIIYDLRPMALDDLGFVPTLERYVRTLSQSAGIKIQLHSLGIERRLPSKMEVASYRLIQESVQNACKHAKASEIQVKIEFHQETLSLFVRDNGIGFNPQEQKGQSFGLIGMRERVELLEGQMDIDSKLGKGTLIIVKIPLMEQEAWR